MPLCVSAIVIYLYPLCSMDFEVQWQYRHEILQKPATCVKFLHKNSVIFDTFCKTNCAWLFTFSAKHIVWFRTSQGILRSTLMKLSAFLLQNSFNYLTQNVLLSNFPLSTVCVKFFIRLTLYIVEHILSYFQICGKF